MLVFNKYLEWFIFSATMPNGKKGYMFHAHSVGHDFSSHIEPIFRDLRKDVKDKKRLKIYLVGGEIYYASPDEDCADEIRAGRQIVLDKIARYGFQDSIREVNWCPLGHVQSLRLILSEGTAEISDDDLEDMIND
ncbi:MAG: hypothetical protein Q8R53_00440 [Nanoarchaeota archaeon]|nr:hypothetical protein [Nanoarchaeota archaeon]